MFVVIFITATSFIKICTSQNYTIEVVVYTRNSVIK
jgi:hypothetical protein